MARAATQSTGVMERGLGFSYVPNLLFQTVNAFVVLFRRTMFAPAGGLMPSKLALLPRLRLGSQDLDRRVFLVSTPRGAIEPGIAGFLGLDALGAKQITFDSTHNELRWRK